MSEETVYSDSPEDMAIRWCEKGARRLHVVDLDGAVEKRPVNAHVVKKLVQTVPVPVQLGGGIRTLETVESYLDQGVQWVILGTAAARHPDLLVQSCRKFPGRIILGIDAKMGRVAVEGWTQETEVSVTEMAKRFEENELAAIIYTDIHRDGMGTGPNLEATRQLAEAIRVPVIASGGISGIKDVVDVCALSRFGVMGFITGRAIYEGKLDLEEAIRAADSHNK